MLNYATVLIILIAGIQFLIDNFIRSWWEKRKINNENMGQSEAKAYVFKKIAYFQWAILILYLVAILLATLWFFNNVLLSSCNNLNK